MAEGFLDKIKNGIFNSDIGIDLGTANVLVYVKGQGIVLREPSVVIVDKKTKQIVKVGEEARKMLGRSHEKYEVVRPLRGGVISRLNVALQMVQHYIQKACGKTLVKPRVLVCVPSCASEVDEHAFMKAVTDAGARQAFLVEEPLAAAIGAGLNVKEPKGKMVVDIGGGTTDIAVISMDTIVNYESIKIAGDSFDEEIMRYVREKYEIVIGCVTAEQIKVKIGTLSQSTENKRMSVSGRSIQTGMPATVVISSNEILGAIYRPVMAVIDAISLVIASTPPELVSDIIANGIVMTGGGSLLPGLDKMVERITGIPTRVAPNSLNCVVLGMGKLLDTLSERQEGAINLAKDN